MESFAEQDVNDQNDIRVQYTAAALSALARMLAGYPGRKNLFWLSESIPFGMFPDALSDDRKSPNSTLPAVPKAAARAASGDAQPSDAAAPLSTQPSQQASPKTTTLKTRNYTDLIIGISNDLADAQVSVYPVDARGLLGPAFFNVANNVSGQGAMGGLAQKAEGRQSEELFQSHYNMRDIAEKTGGMAYYNRNDLDVAVRTGMDDGATYYTLGYYPDNKNWDGQFRKIQVITPKNGAKLRYRAGYYAVDRVDYDRLHPVQRDFDLGQTLNPDYPVATALQFDALVTPPQPGKTTVRVQYAVDPKQISFQKGADGLQHAQLDCAARVFSPKNIEKPLKTEGTRVNAALQPEVFDKIGRTYFPCQIIFELPEGQYLLRLAVRDGSTGLLGSVNAQVTVPAAATAKKD
jgi:VWFA-related protein